MHISSANNYLFNYKNSKIIKVNNKKSRKIRSMFKVNNEDTRTMSRTSSNVFVVNFEHISHLFLIFLFLALNKYLFDAVIRYLQKPSIFSQFSSSKFLVFQPLAVVCLK